MRGIPQPFASLGGGIGGIRSAEPSTSLLHRRTSNVRESEYNISSSAAVNVGGSITHIIVKASTLQQVVFAFTVGLTYYVTRRISGTLIATMALHALWDFSTFIQAHSVEDLDEKTTSLGAFAITWRSSWALSRW